MSSLPTLLLHSLFPYGITHSVLFYFSQVNLEDRHDGTWAFDSSLYVDGIDFFVQEMGREDPWWFSHKHNGPGLRYELATSIQTGFIAWASGPWRAGLWPDEVIFREGLYYELEDDKPVHADRGYSASPDDDGERVFITPNTPGLAGEARRAHGRLHARHEGVNGMLKRFAVLENRFRHEIQLHEKCFFAVVSLVQLTMMVEDLPRDVEYAE